MIIKEISAMKIQKILVAVLLAFTVMQNSLIAAPTTPNWHWEVASETSVEEHITVKFTIWWGDVITSFSVYADDVIVGESIQTGASGRQIGDAYPTGQVVEYLLSTSSIRSETEDKTYGFVIEACNASGDCIKGSPKQITVLAGVGSGAINDGEQQVDAPTESNPSSPVSSPTENTGTNSVQTPGQPTLNFAWNPQGDPFTISWTKWWGYSGKTAKLYINNILIEEKVLSNYIAGQTGQQQGEFVVDKANLVALGVASGPATVRVELCYGATCSASIDNQNLLALPDAEEETGVARPIAPILSGVPASIVDSFTLTIEKLEKSTGNTVILQHTATKAGKAEFRLYKIPVSSNGGQTVNINIDIKKDSGSNSLDRETTSSLEDKLSNDRNFIALAPDGTITLENVDSLHGFKAFVCTSDAEPLCGAAETQYGQIAVMVESVEQDTLPEDLDSGIGDNGDDSEKDNPPEEKIGASIPVEELIEDPSADLNLPGKLNTIVFAQVGEVITMQMYRNVGKEGKLFKLEHIDPLGQVTIYEFKDTPVGVATQSIYADITIQSEVKEAGSWLDNVIEDSLTSSNKIISLLGVKPTIKISVYETAEHVFIPMLCNDGDCTKGDKIVTSLKYTAPAVDEIAPTNPFDGEEETTEEEAGLVLDNPVNAPDSLRFEWVSEKQESDFQLSIVKNYGKKLGDRWQLEDVVDGKTTLYEFPATASGNEQRVKVNITLKKASSGDDSLTREDEAGEANATIVRIESTEPTIALDMPTAGAQVHTFTFLLCNDAGCSRSPSKNITISYTAKAANWVYDEITTEMMTWDFGDDSNPDFSNGAISVIQGKSEDFRLMMNPDTWDAGLKHEFAVSVPAIKHSLAEINNKILKSGGFNGSQNYTAPTPVECKNKDEDGKINGKEAMVYYASWSAYGRAHYPSDLDGCNLTGVLFAFAYPAPNGRLTIGDSYVALEANHEQKPGAFKNDHSLGYLGVLNQLVSFKRKYPKVKTYLSVGGWTWSYALPYMAKYPKLRAQFVKDSVELLKTFQFDGIDIDWEFPDSVEIRENYVQLLSELRVALDAAAVDNKPGFAFTANKNLEAPKFYEPRGGSYHLSIAVSPNAMKHGMYYDWAAINEQVDFVIYMAYDYAGGWGPQTGHQAPLYNSAINGEFPHYFDLNSTSDNYLRGEITTGLNPDGYNKVGLDADKFILGLGYYGRGWAGVVDPENVYQLTKHRATHSADGAMLFEQEAKAAGSWEDTVVDTKDLIATYTANRKAWTLIWDDAAKSTMAYGPYKGVQSLWSYEDKRSICFKTQYAIEQGFGGVFAWESNGDDGSILQTEKDVITGSDVDCYDYEPVGGYDVNYVNKKQKYITTDDIVKYLEAKGKGTSVNIPAQLNEVDPDYVAPVLSDEAQKALEAAESGKGVSATTPVVAPVTTATGAVEEESSFVWKPKEAIMNGTGDKIELKPVSDADRLLRNEGVEYFKTLDDVTRAAVNKILTEIEFNTAVLSDNWTFESALSAPNVARVVKIFSKDQYIKLFPLQNARYNYETMIRSIHAFPKLCGEEGTTDDDCRKELAFIFANMTQETSLMGGPYSVDSGYTPAQWTNLALGKDTTITAGLYTAIDPVAPADIVTLAESLDISYDSKWGSIYLKIPAYRQGLFHITEGSCLALDGSGNEAGCSGREYRGSCFHSYFGEVWDCRDNDSLFYGRGAHQLTHSYNYGRFASFVWGAQYRQFLVDNPNYIIENEPWLLMLSTTYFHMTPTGNKPSMHNLALGTWRPGAADVAGKRENTFGTAINVINGGLECGAVQATAVNRGNYYKEMAAYFGLPTPTDDYLSCAKQTSFYRTGSDSDDLPPLYFYGPYETNSGHVSGSVPPKNTCALTGEETGFSIMQYDMSGYSECVKFNQSKNAY